MAWTRGYERGAGNGIQGLDQLCGKFNDLGGKAIHKAAKAGLNAGLQPAVSAIRKQVNAASISPDLKAAIRRTLGKRVMKKEGQDLVGKVGFGVGKLGSARSKAASARAYLGKIGSMRGVGISSNNIHWFVLGTQERSSAAHKAPIPNAMVMRGLKGKAYQAAKAAVHGAGDSVLTITNTGKIEALMAGVIESALGTARESMVTAMAEKTKQVLAAEAAK